MDKFGRGVNVTLLSGSRPHDITLQHLWKYPPTREWLYFFFRGLNQALPCLTFFSKNVYQSRLHNEGKVVNVYKDVLRHFFSASPNPCDFNACHPLCLIVPYGHKCECPDGAVFMPRSVTQCRDENGEALVDCLTAHCLVQSAILLGVWNRLWMEHIALVSPPPPF